MGVSVLQYVIICPLVFLAGFVDAVAGGGGLISLPAYLIAGLPVHSAIGTNKLSSGMGSALAVWRFSRRGYIQWKRAFLCVLCAWIGSGAGASAALLIEEAVLKKIMLVILPLTALYISRGRALESGAAPYSDRKTTLLGMGIALSIGAYDGFYGPGTGTFLLLFLTGAAHMSLSSANGVAKVINLTTNLSALAVFLLNGKTMLLLGTVAGLFSIAGNYMGTCLFERGGAKSVKPLMIFVLAIFFVKILWEMF